MPSINWLEWSKEAFEKSAKENKPILMDIHGVWCHWCHVMDKTSYDDEEIINIINKDFIPIKVDTDKRPDINKRYNQGGWPTTAFLTSDGQIITGATYVPPDSMKNIMLSVIDRFKQIKIETPNLETKKFEIKDIEINKDIIDVIMEDMMKNFDYDFGGFGLQPKFPMPDAIKLAFNEYKKTKNNDFLVLAKVTLNNMKGIFDEVEYGFYRYSVTQQWSEPHYEKMMDTNSGIIENYLQGYEIIKDEDYKDLAIKSLKYIKNNLSNEGGAFYGSQDADEEYYRFDMKARKKHGKPFIDKNIYTDLSSMMISVYCYAFKVLKDEYYKDFAIKSVDFLLDNNYRSGFGMFHFSDGKQKFLPGILSDNIFFIKALLDLFEITKDKKYLEEAEKLNKFVIENFKDSDGIFFDKISSPDDIGFLKVRDKSITENSIVAINLIRLSNKEYLKIAENILKAFHEEYKKYSIHAAVYGLAVEKFLE